MRRRMPCRRQFDRRRFRATLYTHARGADPDATVVQLRYRRVSASCAMSSARCSSPPQARRSDPTSRGYSARQKSLKSLAVVAIQVPSGALPRTTLQPVRVLHSLLRSLTELAFSTRTPAPGSPLISPPPRVVLPSASCNVIGSASAVCRYDGSHHRVADRSRIGRHAPHSAAYPTVPATSGSRSGPLASTLR